jgi:hypothetical protein
MEGYLKYILYLIAILGVILSMRRALNDEKFRRWLMGSFEEAGSQHKASGKSLSAFMFCAVITLSALISIHYSENHIIPEFIFWGIISLICGLYGIKEVGRVMTKESNGSAGVGITQPVQQVQPAQLAIPDIAMLIEMLKTKHKESGSASSFEDWVKEQVNQPDI